MRQTGYRRLCKSRKIVDVREGRWTMLWNSERRSVTRISRSGHRKIILHLEGRLETNINFYRHSIFASPVSCLELQYIFCWWNPVHRSVHSRSLGACICRASVDGCCLCVRGANASRTMRKSYLTIAGLRLL